MKRHDPIDGPHGKTAGTEGHQWVAMFRFVADGEEYAFEDVQLLSYVPDTANPAVAFDGLVEQEREELAREPEHPAVDRITLSLYDESSAYALAIKDGLNQRPDPLWTFEESFAAEPFDDAVDAFQRTVSSCSPPSVPTDESAQ